MADLTITAANVTPGSNAKVDYTTIAGETITAGGKLKKTSGAGALAPSKAHGIALVSATLNQPCPVITEGDLNIGTGTNAEIYVLSLNSGGLLPISDGLFSGQRLTIVGTVQSNVLKVAIDQTGAVAD